MKSYLSVTNVLLTLSIIITVFLLVLIGRDFLFSYFDDDSTESCNPYNILVEEVETYKVNISWQTDDKCIGYVKYGLSINDLPYQSISNSSQKGSEHLVKIDKVQPGFNYYYIVVSDNQEYGVNGLPLTFTTLTFLDL
jgi:hypothetical protein